MSKQLIVNNPMCVVVYVLCTCGTLKAASVLGENEIEWQLLSSEKAHVALDEYGRLWRENQNRLKSWQGEISFRQEIVVSGDFVKSFRKDYAGVGALQVRVGSGEFLIDLRADLQRSFCGNNETYYTLDREEVIGDKDNPGSFGIILRHNDGHSLWFEPKDRVGEFVASKTDGMIRPKSGIGMFRLATYDIGSSQSSIGLTLDPRPHMMLWDHPVDEVLKQLSAAITSDKEMARRISVHGDTLDECSKLRVTIEGIEGSSVYVFWAEAAGNVVESRQVFASPTSKRPVVLVETESTFGYCADVVVPRTHSHINIDAEGRKVLSRTEEIVTAAVNKTINAEEFSWNAFKPSPGQRVFDAINGKQLIFDRNLTLIDYVPGVHNVNALPQRPIMYWVVFGNCVVAIGIVIFVVRKARKAVAADRWS